MTVTVAGARAALKEIEGLTDGLQMYSTGSAAQAPLPSVGERRRRLRAGQLDPVSTVSLLLNDAGVLRWREGGTGKMDPFAADRPPPAADGELVELYQYERLEPNEINAFLTNLDGKLNADTGLRKLKLNGATVEFTNAGPLKGTKRRLLFVHGTFSKTDAFLNGFLQSPNGGAEFLKRVFAHYDEVLAFDHPTLSVSPILNAFDLFGAMAGSKGPLDIVAHSRGGLVTRWFLEGFGGALAGDGPYRAVLVGCPLGGTSLAAPPRLKDSLGLLTNIGTTLRMGGAAAVVYMPFLAAPLALLKIATSVVSVAAKTPLIDAAVSMVPGLSAQSRVGMNHEIDRSRTFALTKPPQYFVVQSNFETAAPGWRFWEWFRGDRLKDLATDRIFPGANDLVVDTQAMSEFARPLTAGAAAPPVPIDRTLDFGTSDRVHHTNYFEQAETLDFILKRFAVPK